MSKVMVILGIVVTAAAVAVGLLLYVSPGQMQVLGVTPETAAILLVGGFGLIGISAVIAAQERGVEAMSELRQSLAARDVQPAKVGRTGFVPAVSTVVAETGEESAPPAAAVGTTESVIAVSTSTAETVAALDKAKEEISTAVRESSDAAEEEREEEEEVAEAEEESGEEQLYVVEEKLIRGRPARVLSDGTVEAETDEGWMRFENREHLEEYLDAMSPERS